MLTVAQRIDAPAGHTIGVKESIAQDLASGRLWRPQPKRILGPPREKYGNARAAPAEVQEPEQVRMEGVYECGAA